MSSCSKCLAGATPVGDLTVLTERKHLSADSRSCCPFSLWANKAGVSLWTGFNPQYWRDFSHPQWLQWWCRGLGADILSFLKLASRNISFNPLKDGLESWSPFVDFYNDMDVVDAFRKEWRTTSSVVALLGAKVHDVKTSGMTKYGHLYTNVMTLLQPTITRKSYVFQPASSIVLNWGHPRLTIGVFFWTFNSKEMK